jgi:hypothetical protein
MDLTMQDPRKKINSIKILGIIAFVGSVFLFYKDCTKEKIVDKNDLHFIAGPFKLYNYHHSYPGRNDFFTFRLENYSDLFEINIDYLKVVQLTKFRQLPRGEIISIGIRPSDQKYLNSGRYPLLVYSIESSQQIYLNASDSAKIYNGFLIKVFSLSIFGCSLICFWYCYQIKKLYA